VRRARNYEGRIASGVGNGGNAAGRSGVAANPDTARYRDRPGRVGIATARSLHRVDAGHRNPETVQCRIQTETGCSVGER